MGPICWLALGPPPRPGAVAGAGWSAEGANPLSAKLLAPAPQVEGRARGRRWARLSTRALWAQSAPAGAWRRFRCRHLGRGPPGPMTLLGTQPSCTAPLPALSPCHRGRPGRAFDGGSRDPAGPQPQDEPGWSRQPVCVAISGFSARLHSPSDNWDQHKLQKGCSSTRHLWLATPPRPAAWTIGSGSDRCRPGAQHPWRSLAPGALRCPKMGRVGRGHPWGWDRPSCGQARPAQSLRKRLSPIFYNFGSLLERKYVHSLGVGLGELFQ